MDNRVEAVWRILGGLIYIPIVAFVFSFFVIVVAIWWLIDVLWQLATDGEGLNGTKGADLVVRFWDHLVHNVEWVAFGHGKFQWVPS